MWIMPQIFRWHHPLPSCLHSAVSVGRAHPRSPLWGLHQPDPTRRLRGSVDSPVQLCGAPLAVPAHDELQRAEPWLCLCQIRLISSSYQCHSPAAWSHAGARCPPQCPPQHREETPLYRRPASRHQARGPTTGTTALWLVFVIEISFLADYTVCNFNNLLNYT